jgi:hypothetical protein
MFSSHRRDLFCNQVPEVRAIEPGVYEIVTTAHSRPNYIQAVHLADRLVLTNGVHRALAMKRAGFSDIPCVIRKANQHAELGLAPMPFLHQDIVCGVRPAMVADFLREGVSVPLLMRAMDQVLRVTLITEQMTIPSLG